MKSEIKNRRIGIIDGIETVQTMPDTEIFWSDEKWLPDTINNHLYLVSCTEIERYGAGRTLNYLCEFRNNEFRLESNLQRVISTKGWYKFQWARLL